MIVTVFELKMGLLDLLVHGDDGGDDVNLKFQNKVAILIRKFLKISCYNNKPLSE